MHYHGFYILCLTAMNKLITLYQKSIGTAIAIFSDVSISDIER